MRRIWLKSGKKFHDSPYPLAITKPSEILLELEPIGGLYRPNINRPQPTMIFKNKPVDNLGKLLHILCTANNQTLKTVTGDEYTFDTNWTFATYGYSSIEALTLINFGLDPTTPTIDDLELKSRIADEGAPAFLLPPIYEADKTRLRFYSRYITPLGSIIREVGLYIKANYPTLLARAIIPDGIQRNGFTQYEDGYELVLPANYTRSFASLLWKYFTSKSNLIGDVITDVNGINYIVRRGVTSPDLRIGSDNTPPSPDNWYLRGTDYGSLSNQNVAYEKDTALQEIRSIRYGTITPTVNRTVGEIALTIGVYDHTDTVRRIMIARGVWIPAITLQKGTTYTLGIVLKLS